MFIDFVPKGRNDRYTPKKKSAVNFLYPHIITLTFYTPLLMDSQPVIDCLKGAVSPDSSQRNYSETQLRRWEDEPGFHQLLQGIYLDRSLPEQVRWQAAIYFKNSLNSHWRRSSTKPISSEEKQQIRSRLFGLIDENNPKIGDQNAAAIARISRMDFPRDWASLFEDIYQLIERVENDENSSYVTRFNTYKILYHIVKAISMTKLGQAKSRMQEQIEPFMRLLIPRYKKLVDGWQISGDHNMTELSAMSLNCLSKILVEGFDHAHRNETAKEFFDLSGEHFDLFIMLYSSTLPTELVAKHIKILGKMYIKMVDRQSGSFVLMGNTTLNILDTTISTLENKSKDFHQSSITSESSSSEFWEGTLVRALLLIDNLIKLKRGTITMKHRTADDREETQRANWFLTNVMLSEKIVIRIVENLLLYCMRYQTRDIDLWINEPEEFFISELRDSWEFQLRSSGAKVFADLLANFKELTIPKLMSYLQSALENNSHMDILQQDTALQALEMGSSPLSEQLDFDQVFFNKLVPLGRLSGDTNFRVIRARICNVISEWVAVKLSPDNRIIGYNLLLEFLDDSNDLNDLVVQLQAMQAFRYMVDEYMFEIKGFLPFVDQVVSHLFRLLRITTTVEVKQELLKILSILIEQTGESLAPYSGAIEQLIPQAWEEETLQGVVLQILASLIATTQNPCTEISAPILHNVLQPDNLLFEDALPVWKSVVQVSNANNSQQIFNLIPNLIVGIENSTELLNDLLEILAEYFKLSYLTVLKNYGSKLFVVFASYIPKLHPDAISSLCQSMDWLTILGDIGEYGPLFKQSGFLDELIAQTFIEETSAFTAVKIYSLVSRMAINDPVILWGYLSASEGRGEMIWNKWLERYDNIGSPKEQKLQCLGLTRMLYTKEPLISNSLPQLTPLWESVLQLESDINPDEEIEFTTDNKKDKEILKHDPIFTISLREEVINVQMQMNIPTLASSR